MLTGPVCLLCYLFIYEGAIVLPIAMVVYFGADKAILESLVLEVNI